MIKFKEGEIYLDDTDPSDAFKVIKIENNLIIAKLFTKSNPDHYMYVSLCVGCCKNYVSGKEVEVALLGNDVVFMADKVLKKEEK